MLLHVCCADCALKLIAATKEKFGFTNDQIFLYYYNPNIAPRSEYLARLEALQKVFKNDYKLIIPNYEPKDYLHELKEIKDSGGSVFDRSLRCPRCWRLRLEKTFEYAKDNNFNLVSSTLLASQYQDISVIKGIMKQLGNQYGIVCFFPENIVHTVHKGFYKHTFCGCGYSLLERIDEKLK